MGVHSTTSMMAAGFSYTGCGDTADCNVCKLKVSGWTSDMNPFTIHAQMSPKCEFIRSMLPEGINSASAASTTLATISTISDDEKATKRHKIEIAQASCPPRLIEVDIVKRARKRTFSNWPHRISPSSAQMIEAGFFNSNVGDRVICNWGVNDNPMIEHARWFPHCGYAKQLCGAELYRKIQESKRAQQEKAGINEPSKLCENEGSLNSKGQLTISDESTLSRLVAARLDLPISQYILKLKFKLSIIKRCWEDQLKLKHEDFLDECDLFMACIILLKQIEKIDGKKENIIVPSVKMNQIRDLAQAEMNARAQVPCATTLTDSLNNTDDNKSSFSESVVDETASKALPVKVNEQQDTKAEKVVSSRKKPANVSSSPQ
ncbi:unnamed protein product, partial [Rotaria socialis]